MTAMRRTFVLRLAVLLAVATAVADTVVTAEEVISCSVASAHAGLLSLELPKGRIRTLPTRDIYEIRLSDPARLAELAAGLPQVRVTLDSGQLVPPQAVRAREMMRLRLDRAREARAKGLPENADVIDTLARTASLVKMAARCRDMAAALLECGRSDRAVVGLLNDVINEQAVLRGIRPREETYCFSGTLGGVAGGLIGALLGMIVRPYVPLHALGGGSVGCVAGSVIGANIGAAGRRHVITASRVRVNDLIRRVNRAVTSEL